jgi:nucleoside-diphosphate-sugar epimerase
MQTILGAGGIIATELAKALKENYTDQIRLVSRKPERVNDSDEIFAADLLNRAEMQKAVEGSEVVYITVGFPYSYKVWQEKWPILINNAIDACSTEGCKLVFFDNIYMYSKDALDGMTEEAAIDPPSKKGKVRAEIARKVMDAHKSGKIKALIARCADFYGPGIRKNGILNETVIIPLNAGKKANWLGSADHKHSFTYTKDAAAATALLGNTEDAFGEVWHLPTASNPPTGKEWVERVAKELNVKPEYRVASKFVVRILGLLVPIMREMVEMVYEYDRDYEFDSSKFENRFGFEPTSYEEGIRETVAALKGEN